MRTIVQTFIILFLALSPSFAQDAITAILTHPTYNHDCKDGAIDLHINGGYEPYEVKWYKVNTNGHNEEIKKAISQTGDDGNEDLSGLEPGTYMVEVSDALCGIVSESFVLNNCGCVVVEKSYQKNVSKCGNNLNTGTPYEVCDGELRIDVKGTEHYEIEWSNGSHELGISNLCTGIYTVTVTVDGCDPIIESYEICCCNNETLVDEPPYPMCEYSPTLNIKDANITSPSSSTAQDGAIDLKVEGGTGANYSWTGPNGFTSNTEDISGLGVGTYCVTVTNECGGIVGNCYTLVVCSDLNFDLIGNVENACKGVNIGKISISINNEFGPYKYKWNNNEITKDIEKLYPGNYCVTVSNFNGCKNIKCFDVVEEKLYRNGGGGDETGNSCYYNLYCRDQFITTEEVPLSNTSMPPPNCDIGILICEPTHTVIAWGWSVPLRHSKLYYDGNSCVLKGYCQFYDHWKEISGNLKSKYVIVDIPPQEGCERCVICVKVTTCEFSGYYYYIVGYKKVDGWYCGLNETPSPPDNNQNINLKELNFFLKNDSLIAKDMQLLIPKGMNEFTNMNEYIKGIGDFQKDEKSIIECSPLNFENEIKDISEISCEKICGENENQPVKIRSKNVLSENKISISPNPFDEIIKINCNFVELNEIEINIKNVLGTVVYQDRIACSQDQSINLNKLMKGVYLISFIQNNRILETKKIIKQ